MIGHRILYGAIMIGLLVGALFLPPIGVFLIIPVITALMLWEFYGLMEVAGSKNARLLGTAGGVGFILIGLLDVAHVHLLYIAGFTTAVFLRQCFTVNDEKPLLSISATFLGFLYIAVLFNFYAMLLLGWPEGDGRYLLFYMILIVKVTDIGAYATGCSIGRHKLIPRLSPAKTWEGCAGGVLAGLVTSLIFWWVVDGQVGPVGLRIADALILGILLPVTGILGDLIESMLKRAANVKDSGGLMKGMGGILDVLDSLLFAGPVLYLYLRVTQAL
jgi:phosphatidate cytidylyltransferase